MAGNSYKVQKGGKSKGSLFSFIGDKFKLDSFFAQGLPAQYIPHTIFLTCIGVFYIGNNHWAEKTVRKIESTRTEVEELRADYTSLKADYMLASKQSEVARKVKNIGLEESYAPPNKIVVGKGEY